MKAAGPPTALWLAGVALVAAGAACYLHTFSVPFLLDDIPSILDNPTVRNLWPLGGPLHPPRGGGLTVEGRPLLNLSLAVNFALSGTRVGSYHAFNLAIHLLAGLTLLGLVRRTLLLLGQEAGRALGFAFGAALLWTVHPLQTESVTYVVQRAESLMGLFYLLTLYGFVRSLDSSRAAAWQAASVFSCLVGMATKEVMVSAPLLVFCYDRAFAAGSARQAWRRRPPYYLALAATWLPLAFLALGAGSRGGTSGSGSGVSAVKYWLTQPGAVAHYLRLCFWPAAQVFDYGTPWDLHPGALLPPLLLVAGLIALTVWAAASPAEPRAAGGFLGLAFFGLLAPTSLVPGNRQILAEHRMYLASIPVVIVALAVIAALLGHRRSRLPLVAALLAVPCAWAAHLRNQDYRSALALYAADVTRRPSNPFAQANLGTALLQDGRLAEAEAHLAEALRLRPNFAVAHDNLGNVLLQQGRLPEAQEEFRTAIRQDRDFAEAHNNLGFALRQEGKFLEARAEISAALRLKPDFREAENNLAGALAQAGDLPEALAQYRRLAADHPDYADARNDFGIALAQAGDLSAAAAEYHEALRLRPDFLPAHTNLGPLLLRQGRPAEALDEDEAAVRLDPSRPVAHYNRANALLQLGRRAEAVSEYREALRLRPEFAPARRMLEALSPPP